MHPNIFNSPELLAQAAAGKILNLVAAKPGAVICIASGDTPRLTNQYLVEGAKKQGIDFSGVQFVSLDEWVGIPASNTGSCYYFLHETIFAPLAVKPAHIHFFNGIAADLAAECERINQIVEGLHGIDIIVLGIGMNGHIGFNEPGVATNLFAHVIDLDPITLQTGQKYFSGATQLQKGITLGLARIMQSHTAIVMATGSKKAPIIKKAMEGEISAQIPASFIRQHTNGSVFLDTAAAALLA